MPSMADYLCQPVDLDLGGRRWKILITYGVLLECEWLTGIDMLGSNAAVASPTATTLRALVWAAMARDGCQWTPGEVGARMRPKNAVAAREAVTKAYLASMPDPEPEDKTAKPGKPMGWLDTWAAARIELHLSDVEFRAMTPRMFHWLRKAKIKEKQWMELMFSRLTANVINFSMARPKDPVDDRRFMIHRFEPGEEELELGDRIMEVLAGAPKASAVS